MNEQQIKDIVKKMFASGELHVGINIREYTDDELRVTVYVEDDKEDILQSAAVIIPKC